MLEHQEYTVLEDKDKKISNTKQIIKYGLGIVSLSLLFFTIGYYFRSFVSTPIMKEFQLNVVEIGSDYVRIQYNFPENIYLNNVSIDLTNESEYIIQDLLPNKKYNFIYSNRTISSFLTKDKSVASNVENISYYYLNKNIYFTWSRPKTLGGNDPKYIILFNNNMFETDSTFFNTLINSTISFKVKALTGNWSDNYICLYDPQYIIPAFCSIETEKYPLTYSVTSTSIHLESKYLQMTFRNQTYFANSEFDIINLIPDTEYALVVNKEPMRIKTDTSKACGNHNDIDFIQNKDLLNKIQSYTKSCIFSTIDSCVQNYLIKDGLSSDCSLCFGKNSQCAVSNCATKCIINSKSATCINCSVDNCSASLSSCANIPNSIIPDPRQ